MAHRSEREKSYLYHARKYLSEQEPVILSMRDQQALLKPDEYVRRVKSRSLDPHCFSRAMTSVYSEVQGSSISLKNKNVLFAILSPLMDRLTPKSLRKFESGIPVPDVVQVPVPPPADVPDCPDVSEITQAVADTSFLTDMVDIVGAAASIIPGVGTVTGAIKTGAKMKRAYDHHAKRSATASPGVDNKKKATIRVVSIRELPVCLEEIHPPVDLFMQEKGVIPSANASARISGPTAWNLHNIHKCTACHYIANNAYPNSNNMPDSTYYKAMLFFHRYATDYDVGDLYSRYLRDPSHWLHSTPTLEMVL